MPTKIHFSFHMTFLFKIKINLNDLYLACPLCFHIYITHTYNLRYS